LRMTAWSRYATADRVPCLLFCYRDHITLFVPFGVVK
jgi:hypothetical protein